MLQILPHRLQLTLIASAEAAAELSTGATDCKKLHEIMFKKAATYKYLGKHATRTRVIWRCLAHSRDLFELQMFADGVATVRAEKQGHSFEAQITNTI
jgi:hypothetical protein